MKRTMLAALCALLAASLAAMLPRAMASEAPYYTMTQDYRGGLVYSQDGYLPDLTFSEFDGLALRRPADVFVDEEDNVFIADEGNDRVIACSAEGELIRVFGADVLKSPNGIFVRSGLLYVADPKLEQVVVFDCQTGEVVFTLGHPQAPLYGLENDFEPLKVAVDGAGGIYVIGKGNTNGIAQFSAEGTFLGYFGANSTELSLTEKLKRLTYTEQQLSNLKRNTPATPTNLDMDARGLVYTVTSGAAYGGIRRLNMAGVNILHSLGMSFTNSADIAVGADENFFVVNEQGYILEYSRDGRVLNYFGGQDTERTRTGLFVATVAIDVDSLGNLYVVDMDKAIVQRFEITEYATLVHEALRLYQDGRYAESRTPWEKVLRLNGLFDYAQMGLGKAYYRLEMYPQALAAFRLGGDKAGYSDSFWEVRNAWLQANILWIAAALLAMSLLLKGLRLLLRKSKGLAAAVARGHRALDFPLLRQLSFVSYMPKNPADAFYGVKFEQKASLLSAVLLYAFAFLLYLLNKYACGFLFKTVADGSYEIGMDLVMFFGCIALFLIACNLICSIRDGEGTFRQMFCAMAYALAPFLMLTPLRLALTYALTYNEGFLISLVDVVTYAGCLVMIVMMVKTLQEYSFRETVVALLLTLFTMLMIVVALVIAAAMVAQLAEFISAVWKEAKFYYAL